MRPPSFETTSYLRPQFGSNNAVFFVYLIGVQKPHVLKVHFFMAQRDVSDDMFYSWFPPGLKIRENLEKWKGIFQSGKSLGILSRLEKSGNFTQILEKFEKIILENWKEYWKSQGNLSASNSENPANMVPYFK